MANFSPALRYVLENEGGYSDDASDRGGPTNYGISSAVAKRYGCEDVKTLTRTQAASIYQREFWRFDGIENQALATKIFDMCVNFGFPGAMRLLQVAINLSTDRPIQIDAKWGPETRGKVNISNPDTLMKALCHVSANWYERIAKSDSSQLKFLSGWRKRAERVPA